MTSLHLVASAVQVASQRIDASWPWYVIRAAGFIAAGLIVLLMLSGIGQVTGLIYRFVAPIKAWAIHRALAIALGVSIAVHIGFLLIDHYVKFTIPQLFVPFLSTYNNGTSLLGLSIGSLAVAFGIFAMYGVVILVASSLGWIDSKKKIWRKLHYISYAVALLVLIHALSAGSDLKYGTFRSAWIAIGVVVLVGVIARLWRAGTTKTDQAKTDS